MSIASLWNQELLKATRVCTERLVEEERKLAENLTDQELIETKFQNSKRYQGLHADQSKVVSYIEDDL